MQALNCELLHPHSLPSDFRLVGNEMPKLLLLGWLPLSLFALVMAQGIILPVRFWSSRKLLITSRCLQRPSRWLPESSTEHSGHALVVGK